MSGECETFFINCIRPGSVIQVFNGETTNQGFNEDKTTEPKMKKERRKEGKKDVPAKRD